MLLRNVLSKEECQFFIKQAEEMNMKSVGLDNYPTSYRNNDRVISESFGLSSLLFKRIKPFVQPEMNIDSFNEDHHHPGSTGKWELLGLNECFRLCRYQPGGHFSPHYDGQFVRNKKELSLKTVMLYLNDDFEGGTTNILRDDYLYMRAKMNNPPNAPGSFVLRKIKPETGMAIVFDHVIYHEGGKVEGGNKYILRTDAMYKQVSPHNDKQKELFDSLMEKAKALEREGKLIEAGDIYQQLSKHVRYEIGL
jgi:hypothetical protein